MVATPLRAEASVGRGIALAHPRKRRWLVPAIVATVAVGGGVAAALVLMRGGGSGLHGATDRDELVRAAFASLEKGDVDALVAATGTDQQSAMRKCEKDRASEDLARVRDDFTRAVAREKGAKLDVLAIAADGSPEKRDKGAAAGEGCKLELPIALEPLAVKLRVTEGGAAREVTAKVAVVEVDKHFFIVGPPAVPGCGDASAHVAQIAFDEYGDKGKTDALETTLATACTGDHWSAETYGCLAKATRRAGVRDCLAALPADARDKLRSLLRPLVPSTNTPLAGAIDEILPAPAAAPAAVTLGTPTPAPSGDFWIWPRSDGSYLVTSELLDAVFPHQPKFESTKISDGALVVTWIASKDPPGTRSNVLKDPARKLVVRAIAPAAQADAFFANVHLRPTRALAPIKLASKKHGKGFEVADDAFSIELPWAPKLTGAKALAKHGASSVELSVVEVPAWKDLGAAEKKGVVHDRFRHRYYTVTCKKVACGPITKSLQLAPPKPVP